MSTVFHRVMGIMLSAARKNVSVAVAFVLLLLLAAAPLHPQLGEAAAGDYYVGTTDQSSGGKIIVFDPGVADWNTSAAVKWTWAPSASNGFASPTPGWGRPSGVKIRDNCVFGGQWMTVTDSYGLAAIIPYPAGNDKKWSINLTGTPNLHDAELLPNGNIAIAASTGGWVRIYTSSQGPTSSTYVQYNLPEAHNVLWDPLNNTLWALGTTLDALTIGGTPSAPTITKQFSVALPTAHGHDLQPVYGNTDRLWVSTGSKVYQFIKSTKSFSAAYPSTTIGRSGVKSVGDQPSGQVVETVPDTIKSPPGGCTQSTWCTDSVDFFSPDMTRTRTGAAFYKARLWNPNYQ
ncbi:hypothetical protein PAESOLCIP111_00388 [Paenibacillus solanacearum]|uniref:Uncharacterized protein n=1 Tax=Paenibacillus solanacearum TaxID=2048548 RepID=A0A916NLY3_9BACL|nr:DUF6528 family protein [Paenibacillus solanacearum]CAG7600355.1 hypothetical protein PAESOLCIP111_00388 [Paenibacillus solanacearum]